MAEKARHGLRPPRHGRPDDTTALIQLGQAASNAGQNETAIDALERYLELDPDGAYAEPAKQALENLEQGSTDVVTG